MHNTPGFDVTAALTELAEIGVGATILGLRKINIERRRLVRDVPALAPAVDAVLEQVEVLAAPVSALVGGAVSAVGDVVQGPRGDQISDVGRTLSEMGPELLRMSGLTKRD